jgi:hypothetical protein
MRVWPVAFAGAHRCAAAGYFGGRDARMQTTSRAEADLRSRRKARVILEAQGCIIGVNAESAK